MRKKKKKKLKKINSEQVQLSELEKKAGQLPKLKDVDIVLIHKRGNLLQYLIRKVTKGYWDQAALILIAKNQLKGYFHNIIIESVPGGVEIHKLEKYLTNPQKYDVAIKRCTHLTPNMVTRIKAYMLSNIDAPHKNLRVTKFGLALASKKYSGKVMSQERFSGSGLIQMAFYDSANRDKREGYIFKKKFFSPRELEDSTTPTDIAESKHCKWIYNKK